MSQNAEENDANQSKFYRVVSSEPVTDADELFDTLSKFLLKDKKRQLSAEYLDEKDQIASRLSWNNLRNVANSVLDEGSSRRDPFPAWIDQKEAIVMDGADQTPNGDTSDAVILTKKETDQSPHQAMDTGEGETESNVEWTRGETKEEKRAAKNAKKEAKDARKRERAAKREAKKAKKEKKEAKKRKREESGDE
mmetsp:Transcript_22843/g.48590  ORF Transcript_22843/g.48590 Transcript_22843/m.48590 type:complete len:194 (+) Transcript_22843:123-704(+)|eukprot:CAMPEP_0201192098 /NCGR_PEP_ID=MMETSP0851-20130426/143940_1 /ASSEMBLY_ACC=CAM_ASM_000631 /TAXON_ID=183588 /ORGANISM="Pseudo-nitzschia fraudulenta, Strain WWA7" /LENGTH=193 /DNA_ID=CAMNT_0047478347 /DNA_START=127 /DNA_END=708 /DNA_ORIENTATION=-